MATEILKGLPRQGRHKLGLSPWEAKWKWKSLSPVWFFTTPWTVQQAKHLDKRACRELSSYSVPPWRCLLVSKKEEWAAKEPNKCKSSKAKRPSRGCGCLLVLGNQTWRSGPARKEGHPAKTSPRLSNETLWSTWGLWTNQIRPDLKKVETWPQMISTSLLYCLLEEK